MPLEVLALFASLLFSMPCFALEVPTLNSSINDLAAMMPPASARELAETLKRITTRTGDTVVVLTVKSLEKETMEAFGAKAFKNLPLEPAVMRKTVLLIVARKDHKVGLYAGVELRTLFPEPGATRKLEKHVGAYFDGLRPDLILHGGVDFIFKVIRGDVRVDAKSEIETLENDSMSGRGAGAIFAICLAPFLALMVGGLWGIYATQFGVQRAVRLLMGAVLASGAAKIVAMIMSLMGNYSDALWYFILAISIPLGIFGSLTEFWMAGDWSGIPRVKDPVKRKPEDNMGI